MKKFFLLLEPDLGPSGVDCFQDGVWHQLSLYWLAYSMQCGLEMVDFVIIQYVDLDTAEICEYHSTSQDILVAFLEAKKNVLSVKDIEFTGAKIQARFSGSSIQVIGKSLVRMKKNPKGKTLKKVDEVVDVTE